MRDPQQEKNSNLLPPVEQQKNLPPVEQKPAVRLKCLNLNLIEMGEDVANKSRAQGKEGGDGVDKQRKVL